MYIGALWEHWGALWEHWEALRSTLGSPGSPGEHSGSTGEHWGALWEHWERLRDKDDTDAHIYYIYICANTPLTSYLLVGTAPYLTLP
jgi:hypothetical protein